MMTNDSTLFNKLLEQAGYYRLEMTPGQRFLIALAIAGVAVVLFYVCKKLLIPLIKNITNRTKFTWDDHLFNDRVTTGICHLVPPVVFYLLVPLAFKQRDAFFDLVMTLIAVYLVAVVAKLVTAFISSLQIISEEHDELKNKPLRGVYQMMKIIVVCMAVIVALGIIFDKDLTTMFAGLGASAAVLMLVFKDTIMGLVAGVQLSANDMLRPGDWIKVEKHGADGIVFEVSLTTVKVRNWDMTVVTLPPYVLVSDSFQNWRGMKESGGRRIARVVPIDTGTVRFCSSDELDDFARRGWMDGVDGDAAGGGVVNVAVYRAYIMRYLTAHLRINNDMLMMVRQLEMRGEGLPLQVYCFSRMTDLRPYEETLDDVMEHIMAAAQMFGLKMYQRPTGDDLRGAVGISSKQTNGSICNRVS